MQRTRGPAPGISPGRRGGRSRGIIWALLAGIAKARYFLLTGELLTGTEAGCSIMFTKALAGDKVLEEALEISETLATGSQPTIS